MKKESVAFAIFLAGLGASPFAGAHTIRDAKPEDVATCTFLADVSARAPGRKHTRSALGSAMDAARKDAHKAGATDIVWDKVTSATATSVSGKAYKCEK